MTEKMYDNLLGILKYVERLAILILIRQLGEEYTGLCNCLELKSKKGFR